MLLNVKLNTQSLPLFPSSQRMNSSQNALGFGVSAEKDLIIFKLKQLSYIYLNISSNAEIGHED